MVISPCAEIGLTGNVQELEYQGTCICVDPVCTAGCIALGGMPNQSSVRYKIPMAAAHILYDV